MDLIKTKFVGFMMNAKSGTYRDFWNGGAMFSVNSLLQKKSNRNTGKMVKMNLKRL